MGVDTSALVTCSFPEKNNNQRVETAFIIPSKLGHIETQTVWAVKRAIQRLIRGCVHVRADGQNKSSPIKI